MQRMRHVLSLSIGLGLVALGVLAAGPKERRHAISGYRSSPIYREYEAWWNAHPKDRIQHVVPDAPGASSIREISVLRTNVDTDPAFTLRLFPGGRVEYTGHANIEPLGRRTGKIHPWYFRQLASLVQEIGYRKMETLYASKFTDLPGYIFVVGWTGGTRKVILDYGFAGPRTLWALGMTMENLLHEIRWDPPADRGVSKTQPTPTPGAHPNH